MELSQQKHYKQITIFSGCVIKDGKVLMVLRDEEECVDAHLKWEFPGGKVDFGESPQESVERELFEETGVKVKTEQILPFIQTSYWNYNWGVQQTFCFVFLCKFISASKSKKDHHVKEIRWIDLDKVKQLDSLPGTNEIVNIARKVLKI